jgi:glucose/arabinose dehydrogenase
MSLSARSQDKSKRLASFHHDAFLTGLVGLVALLLLSTPPMPSAQAALPGRATAFRFRQSFLKGETLFNPTSLQFGPDGRLYVTEETGMIYAYTIIRNGIGDYEITGTDVISLVHDIPNYNDDGTPSSVAGRQTLGLYATGTPNRPELYVTSSDPRATSAANGEDLGLDTNSGVISHLTWNGNTGSWEKVDLVRGLPRSEFKHATNGIIFDEATNSLYVAQGANTNAGSPGKLLAYLTEYALSAAILSIDLSAIEALPTKTDSRGQRYKYDLPTLQDPSGASPPWGGDDGRNQALLVPGGPVKVHSPGYRNPYDLIINSAGRLYTVDNGANPGWGGLPENEGPPPADCTNRYLQGEPGVVNNRNSLHYIDSAGYYGGHPNPIRGNPAGAGLHVGDDPGTFVLNPAPNWPPVPLAAANPLECNFLQPNAGPGTVDPNQALITYDVSTNGITEYTASTFGGALQGSLLAVGFTAEGVIFRAQLNATGDSVVNGEEVFAENLGTRPLDIIAQGDGDRFRGTIWIALYGPDNILIMDPLEEVAFLPAVSGHSVR